MPNVYAAVFDNKIVKFGRSKNPHKRISYHVTEMRHTGAELTDVFISTVSNDVRDEEILLRSAGDELERIGRETFEIENLEDVAFVFRDARIPFMICRVEMPYKLVVDANSFDELLEGREFGSHVSKYPPEYNKIIKAMRGHGGLRESMVHPRVSGLSRRRCNELLYAMACDGLLNVTKPRGFETMASQWMYSVADGVVV